MQQRFSEQQKSSFLQFVNGSSRLPARAADFEKRFRLQRFYPSSGKADDYLPVAHTWSVTDTAHVTFHCPLFSLHARDDSLFAFLSFVLFLAACCVCSASFLWNGRAIRTSKWRTSVCCTQSLTAWPSMQISTEAARASGRLTGVVDSDEED